jgi:hypothetical protein
MVLGNAELIGGSLSNGVVVLRSEKRGGIGPLILARRILTREIIHLPNDFFPAFSLAKKDFLSHPISAADQNRWMKQFIKSITSCRDPDVRR